MDAIGPFTFVRLSGAPDRVHRMWEAERKSGIDGVAIWNCGDQGEPFNLDSEAVALTYAIGRTALAQYQQLEKSGPVAVRVGTLEPMQKYKVLHVRWKGEGVKRVLRAHIGGDPNTYTALVFATWTLLPLDPFVQPP